MRLERFAPGRAGVGEQDVYVWRDGENLGLERGDAGCLAEVCGAGDCAGGGAQVGEGVEGGAGGGAG